MKSFKKGIGNPALIQVPTGFKQEIPRLLEKYPVFAEDERERIKDKGIIVEYLLFYLSLIFHKQVRRHWAEPNEFVTLSWQSIRSYVDHGEAYLHWLEERGFIESTGYQVENYSREYRFTSLYKFQPYYLKNRDFVKKIEALRIARRNEIMLDPIRSKLFERAQGVRIARGANKWILAQGFGDFRKSLIIRNLMAARSMDLMDGFYIKWGGTCGRIFTPLANLKREIREKFLRIDGELAGELDLRCSQFQILYLEFRNHYQDCQYLDVKEAFDAELEEYTSRFREGIDDLYRHLSRKLGINRGLIYDDLRTEVKDALRIEMKLSLMRWLFSSNKETLKYPAYREASEIFREHFPMLHSIVWEFKWKFPGQLASKLQRFEANAIIHKIAIEKLYKHGFSFMTVHDSVFIPISKYEFVENEIWIPVLRELEFPQYSLSKSVKNEIEEILNDQSVQVLIQ